MRDYSEFSQRIFALCANEKDEIAIMASMAAELYHSFEGFDWVGFYRVTEPDLLKIGPYQGGHGCLTIPFDKGVCGAAARTKKIQLVDDVTLFEGHIACSSATCSELVIPILDSRDVVRAVLDIDSDQPAFFNAQDSQFLTEIMNRLFAPVWG